MRITEKNDNPKNTVFKNKKYFDILILIFAVGIFFLLQLPDLRIIQYPFRLLGTWFHEMGHGLTSILMGGQFKYLEIYENGGGVAYFTLTDRFFSIPTAKAITAAGGLLGPSIAGAILIISSKKERSAGILLRFLIGMILLSLILWIRSYWGVIILLIIAVLLLLISLLKNKRIEIGTLLFLGIQAFFSSYLQLDYLFTKQFERNGVIQNSDTQVIAENTFGTYWFWGGLLLAISCLLAFLSFSFYFKKKRDLT